MTVEQLIAALLDHNPKSVVFIQGQTHYSEAKSVDSGKFDVPDGTDSMNGVAIMFSE